MFSKVSSHLSLFFIFILFISRSVAQVSPGGVEDYETWYIANTLDIVNNEYPNYNRSLPQINSCGENNDDLLNFNPAILSESLCLTFDASLQKYTGRSLFIVGETSESGAQSSLFGTEWQAQLGGLTVADSIPRNFVDLNRQNSWSFYLETPTANDNSAFIQSFVTNIYDKDKVFKSYGLNGETTTFIGSLTNTSPLNELEDAGFNGKMPEFITYTRELTSNEHQRIDSYLGIKYGITLNSNVDYLSSRNLRVWKNENNDIFSSRIFGLGKDESSMLNQLQSESVHLKDHLVASIGEIKDTNLEKQQTVDLDNEQFLIFGDNNGSLELGDPDDNRVKKISKVWLAQRTGFEVPNYGIDFQFEIPAEILQILEEYPEYKIWMLHDERESYDIVSDFEGGHVKFYAGLINATTNKVSFTDINFDKDNSIYDQYTFGVGPELILQLTYEGCSEEVDVLISITGGKPEYEVIVEGSNGFNEEFYTSEQELLFTGTDGVTYTVTLTDANGNIQTQIIEIEIPNIQIDLGPNLVLSNSNPSYDLNADISSTDPDATYKWYKDGILLNHDVGILTIDESGVYSVEVTDGNGICTVLDTVTVSSESLSALIVVQNLCERFGRVLDINISGGVSPYTVDVILNGSTTSYVTNNSYSILDPENGSHQINITDQQGTQYSETIIINQAIFMDVYGQLEALCLVSGGSFNYQYIHNGQVTPIFDVAIDEFTLDASLNSTNSNLQYTWTYSQTVISSDPSMEFGNGLCDEVEVQEDNYTVEISATDPLTGCTVSQRFVFANLDLCPEGENVEFARSSSEPPIKELEIPQINDLTTKVYPNPSIANINFYYEVESLNLVQGKVDLLTVSGQVISTSNIQGNSVYKLSYSLNVSGVYFIRLTTADGQTMTERIIIK